MNGFPNPFISKVNVGLALEGMYIDYCGKDWSFLVNIVGVFF